VCAGVSGTIATDLALANAIHNDADGDTSLKVGNTELSIKGILQ
jgi:hypothetical protein